MRKMTHHEFLHQLIVFHVKGGIDGLTEMMSVGSSFNPGIR